MNLSLSLDSLDRGQRAFHLERLAVLEQLIMSGAGFANWETTDGADGEAHMTLHGDGASETGSEGPIVTRPWHGDRQQG